MSTLEQIQRSLSTPINIVNNLGVENEKKISRKKSLNKLGRKKTVSFSNNISIINVDSWKNYNIDVSESGGCMAWDIRKNEEKRAEEEKKRKKLEEEGCCIIL